MEYVWKSKVKNTLFTLKRVFTFDADLLPAYLRFVKVVVDFDAPLHVSSRIEQIMRKSLIGKTLELIEEIAKSEDKEYYKKFWEQYCIEDLENMDRITPLLRFYTYKNVEGLISLDEYVDNMGKDHKGIYYLPSVKSAKAPFFFWRGCHRLLRFCTRLKKLMKL
ncbi:Heat shock protein 90-5 [Cardamine amara subsp. amara]|uniref:Heat shock protein 90-5 n=1 Tax=Cardamine amara subsp. amara TaxID=228776 RepID=A0ABD1AA51_CARAN